MTAHWCFCAASSPHNYGELGCVYHENVSDAVKAQKVVDQLIYDTQSWIDREGRTQPGASALLARWIREYRNAA